MNKIDNELLEEITQFCKLNNISDINKFINKLIKTGFNIEKYGIKPDIILKKNDTINKEETVINKYTIKDTIKDSDIKDKEPEVMKKEEKVDEPKEEKIDIYGDKIGFFGSNLLD